jgi:hypothetical protein
MQRLIAIAITLLLMSCQSDVPQFSTLIIHSADYTPDKQAIEERLTQAGQVWHVEYSPVTYKTVTYPTDLEDGADWVNHVEQYHTDGQQIIAIIPPEQLYVNDVGRWRIVGYAPINPDRKIAIIDAEYVYHETTLAHELGHGLGCQHVQGQDLMNTDLSQQVIHIIQECVK